MFTKNLIERLGKWAKRDFQTREAKISKTTKWREIINLTTKPKVFFLLFLIFLLLLLNKNKKYDEN